MSTTTFMIRRISREDDEIKQLHATAIKCKEHIQQYYAGKGGIGGGNDVLPVECHEFLPHYSREKDATPKQVVVRYGITPLSV
ncbi:hypothetical protein, variant [Aphanomyces invadans]|uniref:Uncharacterized protein n=1 Tax=Aphanomyces invadans TaxID=157072 RepID=A0A024TPC6_9STRA|nr:hypothetical protein, variant [Aphanomyces invadans]ETV95854.1 hypothetical protein, variant [Aphanomyces invadans]|eukprot:XP_008875604.1 hypothetical protein, variant [Aphanomyces invadans]